MSYTKRPDITVPVPETAVELADGTLVAVACPVDRNPSSNLLTFAPTARWVDDQGVTQVDPSGKAVLTTLTHHTSADEVDAIGSAVLVRECLLLVLGEPLTASAADPSVTIVPWSADVVRQCSIQTAIAAARVTAPVASDVL